MPVQKKSEIIISVHHLKKKFQYRVDRPTSIKTVLVNLLKGKMHLGNRRELEVLNGISFEIKRGEFIGIMGANGVGKSTLLKLLCGIYKPTSGDIQISEQIAPLIELGAGFDGELSGYENIFLNASILGFGRVATLKAVDTIIEFSELGEKIYMPVKNYSSGMLVRLGFSIASHLSAPILLCDEVLAVGDAGFQSKCLKRIRQLHNEGRTIVLVTHDGGAVQSFCKRCIVIAHQQIEYDGPAKQGVEVYLKLVHRK